MKHHVLFLLAASAMIAVACSDSNSDDDGGTPPGELTVLRLPPTAPELCSDTVSALFTKRNTGGPQEIALQFQGDGGCGDNGKDFLRLRLERNSLLARPDGSPINVGDTITIRIKWVGSDSVLFEMQPTGLTFSPTAMARLRIQYDECHGDLNGDDQEDEDDDAIEGRLSVYRQEQLGDDFFRVTDTRVEDEDRIDADLPGFSRYMIAY